MNSWRRRVIFCVALGLMAAIACTKHPSESAVVEIPSGFSGSFQLEMGVKNAPPLLQQGDSYVITVPRSGTLSTSTLLENPKAVFQNSAAGHVWGYSHQVFTTGDGIPIGGKIEFFVGSKKDYEAEEKKKDHSGGFPTPGEWPTGA